jgi:glucose-6-phosphate isomerase
MTLRIDFTNMMAGALPDGLGITESEWRDAAAAFRAAHAAVNAQRDHLGFLTLPSNTAVLESILVLADAKRGQFADVLLLGIGGSALGPIALRTALRPLAWNTLDSAARGGFPRLHVLDNVDPTTIATILERLDLAKTLVLVVSKSGGHRRDHGAVPDCARCARPGVGRGKGARASGVCHRSGGGCAASPCPR